MQCNAVCFLVLLVPRIENFVVQMISLCYFQKTIQNKSIVCFLPLHQALIPLRVRNSFQDSIFISLYMYVYMYVYICIYMYVYMYMYILYKVDVQVNPRRKAHNTLQATARHCKTLHHNAPYFNTLQRTLQQTLT